MQKFSNFLKKAAAFGTLVAIALTGFTAISPIASAQTGGLPDAPFTAGNLVIYRVGNGTDALTNLGSPVFLDEYTPAGVLVQSIPLPTTMSGTNRQLIASGTSSSEGFLTRSIDGRYLLVTGYARDLGGTTNITGTASTDVNRVVGRVDASGAVDTTTALTDASTASSPRSATSTNGTDIYFAGGAGGLRYTTFGSTTSTQINTGLNALTNLRQINIFSGQLYFSTGSGTNPRIGSVGTGTPTTAPQDSTPAAGIPGNGSPYGFFFADLSTAVAGVDTLYIADDTGATGGIQKYSLVGGTWTANGIAGVGTDSYRGLTGTVSGTTVTLYSTRKGGTAATGGGEFASVVDATGYNATITATPTLLATADTNKAFRGIAFAPTGGTVPPAPRTPFDFDGDGKADIAVFRPSTGGWFRLNSSNGSFSGTQFGASGDLITPADYDNDGKTDIAVFRSGTWFISQSSNGAFVSVPFGSAGDLPRPGDFDGDGRADVAVFRPSTGAWYRLNSSNGAFVATQFGASGDTPVIGDFDGDTRTDLTVFRPSNGVWYRLSSSNGAFVATQFGTSGDFPDPADFDGDAKSDINIFRPSNGTFYRLNSNGGAFVSTQFGTSGDVPVAADYDGDARADVSVFRPSSGAWFRLNSNGGGFFAVQFGATGDTPIPSAYIQ